jgi:hypothetical protein
MDGIHENSVAGRQCLEVDPDTTFILMPIRIQIKNYNLQITNKMIYQKCHLSGLKGLSSSQPE